MTAITTLPQALREIERLRAEVSAKQPVTEDRPRYFGGIRVGPKIGTEYEAGWVADLDKTWRKIGWQVSGEKAVTWRYVGAIGVDAKETHAFWDGIKNGRLSMVTGRDDAGRAVAYARRRAA